LKYGASNVVVLYIIAVEAAAKTAIAAHTKVKVATEAVFFIV